MAAQIAHSRCASGQRRPAQARHMSLDIASTSISEWATNSTAYSMATASPTISPTSSLPSDLSPSTMWSANLNAPNADFYQSPMDGGFLETPTTSLSLAASPECPPFLNQVALGCCQMDMSSGLLNAGQVSVTSSTDSSDGAFTTFEPIGTIASRNERRKAQNRAAQRAFRVRQQQALAEANLRMRSLQKERDEAVGKRDHFERLFKSLSQEHERLLDEFHELLASVKQGTLAT